MVDRLDPFPAYLKGRRWDVLAANRAARALFADWPAAARRHGRRPQRTAEFEPVGTHQA